MTNSTFKPVVYFTQNCPFLLESPAVSGLKPA